MEFPTLGSNCSESTCNKLGMSTVKLILKLILLILFFMEINSFVTCLFKLFWNTSRIAKAYKALW